MAHILKKIRGFTIVEVLVASFILVTAITGIIAAMRTSRELQTYDNFKRQARNSLENLLEQYVTGTTYATVLPVAPENVTLYHLQGGTIPATRSLAVASELKINGTDTVFIKHCTASITWADPWNGGCQSLTIHKMVARL